MIRTIEFRAMNTSVMFAAEGELAVEGMQAAKSLIDECEQRFSRFLPASELSQLNRLAGEWVPISEALLEMLWLSAKYHQDTDGIFDPAISRDLKRAGYDRSMDDIREGKAPEDTSFSSQLTFTDVQLDLAERRVYLPIGMELDLGGIAKGWIVEKAAHLLHTFVPVCGVSAGGDILLIGQPSDGMDWNVYLEDPRDPLRMLAQFHLSAGAVATSSIMKRSWVQGEKVRHHLIDPRTGEPAQTDWLSVTVICPNIIDADVYAKSILIGGEKMAKELLTRQSIIAFVAVDSTGNLTGSSNYKDFMYEPATDILVLSDIHS